MLSKNVLAQPPFSPASLLICLLCICSWVRNYDSLLIFLECLFEFFCSQNTHASLHIWTFLSALTQQQLLAEHPCWSGCLLARTSAFPPHRRIVRVSAFELGHGQGQVGRGGGVPRQTLQEAACGSCPPSGPASATFQVQTRPCTWVPAWRLEQRCSQPVMWYMKQWGIFF